MNRPDVHIGDILNGKYRIISEQGRGESSTVFKVLDLVTREHKAVKLVPYFFVRFETGVLRAMHGTDGIPEYFENVRGNGFFGFVLSLGFRTLEHFKNNSPGNRLSQKTILTVGFQLISILEKLHTNQYIHRNIKSDNICLSRNTHGSCPILLVDYSWASNVSIRRAPNQGEVHLSQSIYSTPRMMNQSVTKRRDDLMMVLYLMIDLHGVYPFFDPSNPGPIAEILRKKEDFELNPHLYLDQRWLIEISQEIISVPVNGIPNYDRIKELLKTVKRGFNPSDYVLTVVQNANRSFRIY